MTKVIFGNISLKIPFTFITFSYFIFVKNRIFVIIFLREKEIPHHG